MKNLSLLFLFLIVCLSCAKKKEDWAVYQDQKYPIAIKHLTKKMKTDPFFDNEKKKYWIDVEIDIGNEFPHREVAYADLYDVIVENQENFDGYGKAIYEINYEETDLNGTPAIASKDEKGRIRTYILLVPKIYAYVWLSGVDTRQWNPKDIAQTESDRVEQLTYEMIQHFKWEQKIDTSSEEFKAWKAHIWEILKNGKDKNEKK